jgi:plasmid stability protein
MIQIRNVPDDVHRRAKARAALAGLTLSEYALQALRLEVDQPTVAEIAERIRALDPVESEQSAADMLRQDRDSR